MKPADRKEYGRVFDQFGIKKFSIERRGRHPHLIWDQGGRQHRMPVSGSASDHRTRLNELALLKRYIRNQNDTPSLH